MTREPGPREKALREMREAKFANRAMPRPDPYVAIKAAAEAGARILAKKRKPKAKK
jgi:hypothetical protein